MMDATEDNEHLDGLPLPVIQENGSNTLSLLTENTSPLELAAAEVQAASSNGANSLATSPAQQQQPHLPSQMQLSATTSNQSIPLTAADLLVDISDALSEKDKVKFTVHTRTTLPAYIKTDMYVVRQHEEFIWLHDRFEENEEYAGYIIPPCPPRPDFDASREKLQRLGEGEGNMTKEEFKKMKLELEAEYLAQFKKTVAMHEVFLTRLATHPVFRNDQHLKVFLEYDQDLCAKPRSKMNVFGGLVKSLGKTTDELYLGATVRDVNDFFENELQFLTEYHQHLKEAASRVEKMTSKHKDVADNADGVLVNHHKLQMKFLLHCRAGRSLI